MALADGIVTLFTTYARRNPQAANVTNDERTEAAAFAVAVLNELFGDEIDESDVIMRNYGFLEATLWLKGFASLKVESEMQPLLDAWEKKKAEIYKARKAMEDKPRRMKRETERIDAMFQFGRLPWDTVEE